MKFFIKLFLLLLIFLSSSCAKNLKIEPVIAYKIKDRNLARILDSLSTLKPRYFYTKIKINYEDNATAVSFKTSLKIVSDSALNAIVSKIGIPIVNGLITTDSAKILDIQEKCFYNSSWDNFRNLLNIEIDYPNLENILLGRPLTDQFNQKYFVDREEYDSIIAHSKKLSDTVLSVETLPKSKLQINYLLRDNLKDLAETRIFSTNDSTDIRIQYLSREMVSGFNLPNKVVISLSKSKYSLVVKLEYDKTTVNEKIEIIFTIPEKYEVCN
jgi:hypothetical protein